MNRRTPNRSNLRGRVLSSRAFPLVMSMVVLGVAVVAFVLSPMNRWSIATTFWGTIGLGSILWWFQEQNHETIETTVWLRKHQRDVQRAVFELWNKAWQLARVLIGPTILQDAGASEAHNSGLWNEAALALRQYGPSPHTSTPSAPFIPLLGSLRADLSRTWDIYRPIYDRFPSLHPQYAILLSFLDTLSQFRSASASDDVLTFAGSLSLSVMAACYEVAQIAELPPLGQESHRGPNGIKIS